MPRTDKVTANSWRVRLIKCDMREFNHALKGAEAQHVVSIKKLDEEEQLVFGEVYAPGFPDSQDDFMSPAEIKKMAYNFLRKGLTSNIDVNHSEVPSGSYVVESFIARKDDQIYIPDSWVLGVHVPDVEWAMVKSGELNGFSFDGYGIRTDTVFECEMPDVLKGETDSVQGHIHVFTVKFDEEGSFLGGYTAPGPLGHVHAIKRGTLSEPADHHAHRFSFVEGLLDAKVRN